MSFLGGGGGGGPESIPSLNPLKSKIPYVIVGGGGGGGVHPEFKSAKIQISHMHLFCLQTKFSSNKHDSLLF